MERRKKIREKHTDRQTDRQTDVSGVLIYETIAGGIADCRHIVGFFWHSLLGVVGPFFSAFFFFISFLFLPFLFSFFFLF